MPEDARPVDDAPLRRSAACRAGRRPAPAATPGRRSPSRSRRSGRRRTYCPPRGTTRSRSISERTVSTAKSGMPSDRSTSASRTSSGSPCDQPVEQRGHVGVRERLEVQRRSPDGWSPGRVAPRAAPAGPAAARSTGNVADRRAGARGSASSPSSACWASSMTSTTGGLPPPSRSKNVVHAENRSSRGKVPTAPMPSRAPEPGLEPRRAPSASAHEPVQAAGEQAGLVLVASAVAAPTSSSPRERRSRPRTASASA